MHSRCSPAYSGTELSVDFRFACSIIIRNLLDDGMLVS